MFVVSFWLIFVVECVHIHVHTKNKRRWFPIVLFQLSYWLFFQKITAVVVIIDLERNIARATMGAYAREQ